MVPDHKEKYYSGMNSALPSLGATCDASVNPSDCGRVMNGNLIDVWSSKSIDHNQWIKLQLNDTQIVERIDIYHKCRNRTQCSEMMFSFSDGRKDTVS